MPSLIIATGAERGTHLGLATGNAAARYADTTFGTLGTNVELVAAAARSGNYGFRLTASAGTANFSYTNSANNGTLGTAQVLVVSFWFRFPTLPSGNATIFEDFGTAGGNDAFIRYNGSSGILEGIFGATVVSGPSISANTWYQVDALVRHDTNPHTMDWRVDGAAQTQVSLSAAAEDIFRSGWGNSSGSQTSTLHVDDVVVSTTAADYPLGGHKVVQLIPDTGGTATQIGTANATARFTANGTLDTTFSSANILAALSEVPPTIGATASGIHQRTSGSGNAANIPMSTYTLQSGESVSGVRVVVTGWAATTTANNLGIRTHNGTTETTVFATADPNFDNSTTAPASVCKMATLADFDTQAELDAMAVRIGYSTDVSPVPGAHAIYAEVAVLESTGPTTWTADAALSVTATLTAVAAGARPADASLTVTATLGAAASPARVADAALAITATLTGAADRTATAAAALPVTATLAAATAYSGAATASLAVTAALAAAELLSAVAAAPLAATATLTAAATRTATATAALPVTATLSTAAALTAATSATLAATVTLTATAVVGAAPLLADAALAVTATLAAAASRTALPAASLPVTATLAATGSRTAQPVASLTVVATLAADPDRLVPLAATLPVLAILAAAADAQGGVTFRPFTGTTARPAGGTTARPATGTTARPATGTTPRPDTGTTLRP